MSNRSARQEQLRRRERNNKIKRVGLTGLALAAGSLVAANQLRDDGGVSSQSATPELLTEELEPEIVEALLLSDARNPGMYVSRLINAPGRVLADSHIGERRFRVIQAGGELNMRPFTHQDVEIIQDRYTAFTEFAQRRAQLAIPISVRDPQTDTITAELTADVHIEPLSKDMVVFVVPSAFDIGRIDGNGNIPLTATDAQNHEFAMSFIRPDDPMSGLVGMTTEACQASVRVLVDNEEDFPEIVRTGIRVSAQEAICNALGDAYEASWQGVPYDAYQQMVGGAVFHTGEQDSIETDFVTTTPRITSESVFRDLYMGIPEDIGNYLMYPPAI